MKITIFNKEEFYNFKSLFKSGTADRIQKWNQVNSGSYFNKVVPPKLSNF